MKVKSYLLGLTMLLSTAAFTGNAATVDRDNNKAATNERVVKMTKEQKEARVAEMKARIKEIKKTDRSQLSNEERKAIRKELRSMSKEARQMGYYDVTFIFVGGFLCSMMFLMIVFA